MAVMEWLWLARLLSAMGGKLTLSRYPVARQLGNQMSAVISGLVGGAVAVALLAVARGNQRSGSLGADGWRLLRAGWLLHGTFVACVAFAALIAVFLLSGGSSRADSEAQNLYAVALGLGFGLAALYVGWTTYGRTIAWKDHELRVRTIFGGGGSEALCRRAFDQEE